MEDSINEKGLSTRDVFIVLFKRKGIFFTITLLTTLLVIIGSYVMPGLYKAEARIYVERTKSFAGPGLYKSALRIDREAILNSEVMIMNSRTVAKRTVAKLNLHEHPAADNAVDRFFDSLMQPMYYLGLLYKSGSFEGAISSLRKKLKAKPTPKSDIIKISYKGKDPEFITKVVNTLIDTYLERRLEMFRSIGTQNFYSEQVKLFKKKIGQLKAKKQEMKSKWSISQISKEIEAGLDRMEDIKTQLRSSEIELVELNEKIDIIKQFSGYVPFNNRDGNYYIIDEMGKNLLKLEMEKDKFEQEFNKGNNNIEFKKDEIEQLQNRITGSLLSIKKGLLIKIDMLKSHLSGIQEKRQTFNKRETQLNELADDIEIAQKSYTKYIELQEQARVTEAGNANLANVRVLDYASVPDNPIFPRLLIIILGMFFSVVSASIIILLLEYFDHKINSTEDLECLTGVRTFAVIPKIDI